MATNQPGQQPAKPPTQPSEPATPFQSVITTLDETLRSLTSAQEAVGSAYQQAGPAQRAKLEETERDLFYAGRALYDARDGAREAQTTQSKPLPKDAPSQFKAAKQGKPQSIAAQQPKPTTKPQPKKSVKLATDKSNALTASEGKAKQKFKQADKPDKKAAEVPSSQVSNSEPKPRPKPSLDIAGGSDAVAHSTAKSADAVAARRAEIGTALRSKAGTGEVISASQSRKSSSGQGMGQ